LSKPRVLIQLDCDSQPSSFDAIVAVDAGAERLLAYAEVEPLAVRNLVHGAMFTRGGEDLKSTAIFLGGSDVGQVEDNLRQVLATFFGPVRVSVMADPNGSNTTAAAAVVTAAKHVPLHGLTASVLGGTGPVGLRICQLLAARGATVTLVSRQFERARAAAELIRSLARSSSVLPVSAESADEMLAACAGQQAVFAAGAAGVRLLDGDWMAGLGDLRVAIDCNAVPPAGLAGIAPSDRGRTAGDAVVYGALGVGGLKMKIHKRCIARLFEANDLVLNLDGIMEVAESLALTMG
jgi:methylenetetrahydrofolate/methylenetetrahydromethanopterin dehydrogenase (NADP+)